MGKYVVGVIGTQNTGKSTFINDILEKFKGTEFEFKTVGCDYRRKIEERGLKINRNGNLESQKIIFDTLVEQLDTIDKMPGDGCYITDRSPIDAYVYTKYLKRHEPKLGITDQDLHDMYWRLHQEIGKYSQIVFLDLNKCGNVDVVDDKFRDTNLEYRDEIDKLFKETILDLILEGVFPSNKVVSWIQGNRECRIRQFIAVMAVNGVMTEDMARRYWSEFDRASSCEHS